jgi:3'-phosphoadenosine 5'-phosphosulfate sulfotransferase (PAPS reductase)/FAD synthetase
MKRFLSLGAGVQSSTLALMIAHGEIEPVEAAIFADTGWEPRHVYEWLNWLEEQLPFPVCRVQYGNLRTDTLAKRGGQEWRLCRGTW